MIKQPAVPYFPISYPLLMVFSFFKKPPEKMVARPAAMFRSEERGENAPMRGILTDSAKNFVPPTGIAASDLSHGVPEDDPSSDFTDFDFDTSLRDLQVDAEVDPIDADVEQAAILYADGHDDAARSLLEDAVRVHHYGPGERLWLMLFDLYLLTGHKTAFETLAGDYAQCFGQCSPGWRDSMQKPVVAKGVGNILFKGELSGNNDVGFSALRQGLEKNPDLRLDLSKVKNLDEAGCGRLLGEMQKTRKARREIELLGGDNIRPLLEARIQPGRPEEGDCWLLLLEVYQAVGLQERFEDLAIDYAVTFEISPPSWESKRVSAPLPAPTATSAPEDESMSEAYVARGNIKAARFTDLAIFIEVHDPVIIDCSNLVRIDFISAGALLNVLSSAQRAGKQLIFRHPHHLIAELFGVVGLTAVAEIVSANI